MKLPIRIIVRTDVDWANMTWERFYSQKAKFQPTMAIIAATKPHDHDATTASERGTLIRAWERATGRGYFQFRGEVRAEAEKRLKRLRDVKVTIGLHRVEEWLHPINDEILIPLDDDDEILSNVTELATAFDDGVGLVLWNRLTDMLGERSIATPRNYIDTCNMAIRKSYLLQWPEHLAGHFLNNHQVANLMMKKRLGLIPKPLFDRILKGERNIVMKSGVTPVVGVGVKAVDACYSCYHLHSASISFLMRKMRRDVDPEAVIRELPLHSFIESFKAAE